MQTKALIIILLVLALSSLVTCIRLTSVDDATQGAQSPDASASSPQP
jgi:hypothetical protein